MKYDFKTISVHGGQVFLDSGTTFVYFGGQLYGLIRAEFESFCSARKSNCGGERKMQSCYIYDSKSYRNITKFFAGFPILKFEFNGKQEIAWYPEDYLVKREEVEGVYYCPGMKKSDSVVLGATFMRNYDINFNKAEKSVTFVRSNCGETEEFISNDSNLADRNLRDNKNKNVSALNLIGPGESVLTDRNLEKKVKGIDFVDGEIGNDKLKPDFYGFEKSDGDSNDGTEYRKIKNKSFLFYYMIVFVVLVVFLVILMVRFMVFVY